MLRGLTQDDIQAKCDISSMTVTKYFRFPLQMSGEMRIRMRDALSIDPLIMDDICEGRIKSIDELMKIPRFQTT